jgi:hypothetical protein
MTPRSADGQALWDHLANSLDEILGRTFQL